VSKKNTTSKIKWYCHLRDATRRAVVAIEALTVTCLAFVTYTVMFLTSQLLTQSFPSLLQEKTKKILDIWLKSNTFPSAVLTRLHKLVKEADQEKGKGAYHVSRVFAKYSSIRVILPFVLHENPNVRYELKCNLVCVRTRKGDCSNGRSPNAYGSVNHYAACALAGAGTAYGCVAVDTACVA
jgi:hypothetical protein